MSISKRDVSREVESVFTALAKARVRKDMDPEVLKSSQYLDKKLVQHLKLDWYNEQAVKSEARRQANQPPDWICLLLQRDRDARRAWQLLKSVQTTGWGGSASKPKPAKGQPQNPEKEAYVDSAALAESKLELQEERAAQGLSAEPTPALRSRRWTTGRPWTTYPATNQPSRESDRSTSYSYSRYTEQAERDLQLLTTDDWVVENSQPGDGIDPQAYSILGSLLNSQSLGRDPPSPPHNSTQTPAVSTANASSMTTTMTTTPLPPANPNRRILFGLLACVVMLFGTSTYCLRLHQQNRAWEAENASLRAKIIRLENSRTSTGGSLDANTTPPSCPGSQLIDTCWIKVGFGDCTKDALEDPVKPLEDALRYAWDSTAEVIGAVTDTVASDLRQVCDAMQSFGSFIFEL
eukprot:g10180.t1